MPVYNTPEEDLTRLLNSILRQTYINWTRLFVDDGSNKITADYLDQLSKEYEKICVKHTQNRGCIIGNQK